MAVVEVSTDLSGSGLIVDASTATAFVEPTGSGSVSGEDYADIKSLQDEADVYIQGIASVSGAYTTNAAQRGCAVTDSGVGGVSIPTDGAIMVWQWWISPSALASYATAGMFVAVGSGQSDLEIFPVSGNDLDPAPLGGWYCYPVDPREATFYETVGTPDSTTFRWIGGGIAAPKQARGLTHYAIDAIRFGRCTSVITGGDGADPDATFLDISDELQNGAEAGGGLVSYGTFDNIFGAFYMQGLLQMGITGTNPCVFTDSNTVINIRNTPAVGPNFNRWEIQNASSIITLTGCSFNNIGVGNSVAPTASKGDLSVVDSTATVNLTTCSFSDWGTFSWGSGTTLDGVAFRRCDLVTQNGATINGCTFDKSVSSVSLAVSDLSLVTDNTFVSDGSNHAIDLGTQSNAGIPINIVWNNDALSTAGYDVGSIASPITPTNTGNEAITVNVPSGETLNIAVGTNRSAPSVRNTAVTPGTINVTSGGVTIDLTVKDQSAIAVQDAFVYIDEDLGAAGNIANVTTNADGTIAQQSYSGPATTATIRVRKYGYKPFVGTISLTQNSDTNVTLITDPQQF